MKRMMIFAATLFAASVAHADPVSVTIPRTPTSAEEAAAYVASLDKAVKQVCREAAGPIVGVAYYGYLACLKDTRAEVAKLDPTGLYAGGESKAGMLVAAK
jgi:hypothetical protein